MRMQNEIIIFWEQIVLIEIYRTFHKKKKTEYTFFSGIYGTFSKIDHMTWVSVVPIHFRPSESGAGMCKSAGGSLRCPERPHCSWNKFIPGKVGAGRGERLLSCSSVDPESAGVCEQFGSVGNELSFRKSLCAFQTFPMPLRTRREGWCSHNVTRHNSTRIRVPKARITVNRAPGPCLRECQSSRHRGLWSALLFFFSL